MKKTMSAVMVLGMAMFATTACDVPEESEADEEVSVDAEGNDLDEVFVVTRVEMTENGPGRIEQWETTRRMQLAEAALDEGRALEDRGLGEASAELSTSSGPICNVNDLRLFSATNYTGSVLCVYGTAGYADLHDYLFGGPIYRHWDGNVRSYKVGGHWGALSAYGPLGCGTPCDMLATQSSNYSGTSEYLFFKNGCIPC